MTDDTEAGVREFDAVALHVALDAQRRKRGLSWRQLADEIWEQSAELNRQRHDHPISPSTLSAIAERGDTSCQHALFVLRWLGCAPESFLSPPRRRRERDALPAAGPDRRLRWDLPALYAALDAKRRERQLTWMALARELRCSAHQLQGIRTARFAIGMKFAMRVVQWLDRSASSFVHAARW
jgi:hypothetical protein